MTARRGLPHVGRRVTMAAAGLILAGLIAGSALGQQVRLFGDVLLILALVSTASALMGAWLVLRKMAMMADAIAHAILFGLVAVMFVLVRMGRSPLAELGSPAFVLGAAVAGLLTVFLTESLLGTRLVREDAATGMVFSFLFAAALVAIALSFRDAHVDEHLVLAGGVEITALRHLVLRDVALGPPVSLVIGGLIQRLAPEGAIAVTPDLVLHVLRWDLGPRAAWTVAAILLVDAAFVAALWKELKLTTFDPALAASLGFAPLALNYALMSLVSVTAVGAFEAVGSIIVIALFIAPPATAYLLTDRLGEMVGLSLLAALAATWLGFVGALRFDINFGGAVAVAAGALFLLALVLAPEQGLLGQILRRRERRREFAVDMLLVHLAHHIGTAAAAEETAVDRLPHHLRWSPEWSARIVRRALGAGLVERSDGCLALTAAGRARAAVALERSGG